MATTTDSIKFDSSLFQHSTTSEQVRKIAVRTQEYKDVEEHLEAAKALISFNLEKARQTTAVDEQIQKHLNHIVLKYEEKLTEQRTRHEQMITQMKTTFEVHLNHLTLITEKQDRDKEKS